MLKFYTLLGALLFLFCCAFAQTTTISINSSGYSYSACTDVPYKLPVTIQGQFNADNKFSVQIKYYYGNVIAATVPAVLNDGKIEFTINNSELFANSYSPSVQFKVLASSPYIESAWMNGSTYVYTRGDVNVSSASVTDTVNIYDEIRLQLKGTSNSEIRVTLTDSTKFNISAPYNGVFTQIQNFPVTKAGTFTIAHAENGCGAMQVSGSFKPVVNPTSLTTVAVAPQAVCENGEVKISFSTSGTPLTGQTKYRIRFIQLNSSSTKQATAEVPAQLTGNVLTAKFPATFLVTYTQDFAAQIITENPSIVGSISNTRFRVAPQPSAVFNTASQTININDYVYMQMSVSGLPPFTVELSDGTSQSVTYSGNFSMSVRPYENTSYSIKSLTSGCGRTVIANPQTVNISVRPGIRIEDEQKRQIICTGSKARIKFRSSAALTGNTLFNIQASNGNESFTFPAVRIGEYLEFEMPNRSQGYSNFYYKIITTNPSLESPQTYYILSQTTPTLAFSQYNKYSYEMPGKVQVGATLYGGGPFVIENMDGTSTKVDSDYLNTEFYLKETQEYKIKSISNSCYKNENLPSAKFSLVSTESPGIYIDQVKRVVCNTDSVEITFGTVGKFSAENTFAIQGYSANCCTFQTLSTTKQGGRYKIKLPATQSSTTGAIRVASTNPVVFSDQISINIQQPTTQISLYPEGKQEAPAKILAGSNSPYLLSLQSSYYSQVYSTVVIYTDNGVEKTYINNGGSSTSIPLLPAWGTTSEYVIKSVSDACGTYASTAKTFISWMPYNIQFSDQGYSSPNYCIGGPIGIPFGITDGVYTNATFSLQIRKTDATNFTTLVSGETGRVINTTIPTSVTAGRYAMRIVSSDGAISPTLEITIGTTPTATFSLNPQSSANVDYGQSVYMDINVPDANYYMPATVIFEDGSKSTISDAKGSRYIYVQKSGEYSIKSIANACGYGTASGSVKVSVKPKLNASTDSYNICEGGSLSVSYTLGGDADLSDDYIRFELFDYNNNTTTILDSTKTLSGTKLLKIPAVLKGSYYQIRLTVKKYQLTYNLGVSITTRPDASLRGSTTVNSGESTRLTIKANKTSSGEAQYVLSDGTKGSFWAQSGYNNYISVSPRQTTTYTIISLTNSCGEGTKSGSAIVEVNAPSERTVTVTALSNTGQLTLCTGDTASISYVAKGSFSAGNQMTVQISDTTGRNFRSITTIGNASPIKGVLPTDLIAGKLYRIRVIASDPNTGSGAFEYPISANQRAKARFASESVTYDGISNPRIVVLLEGGAPWSFVYGTDVSSYSRTTSNATESIELFQASPSQYYKLFRVSNSCGLGTIGTPSTVRVEVITGLEPATGLTEVKVAPNPAQEILKIMFTEPGEKNIRLFDLKGSELIQKKSRITEDNIDIRNYPAGVYIIQVEAKGKKQSFKVIKN